MTQRILVLDIETSPNICYTWGLFKQDISIGQIIEPTRMICWAAKWVGEKKVHFASDFHDGTDEMLSRLHDLLSETTAVVHFNGTSFDMPHIKREFIKHEMPPLPPIVEIDLLRVVKKNFRLTSNKLDYVAQYLGIGAKVSHAGFSLWKKYLDGDEQAANKMRAYNKGDVVLTEKVYTRLLPHITNHPSYALSVDETIPTCNRCGSYNLVKRGYTFLTTGKYQRFVCAECGGWSRSVTRESGVTVRGV